MLANLVRGSLPRVLDVYSYVLVAERRGAFLPSPAGWLGVRRYDGAAKNMVPMVRGWGGVEDATRGSWHRY